MVDNTFEDANVVVVNTVEGTVLHEGMNHMTDDEVERSSGIADRR